MRKRFFLGLTLGVSAVAGSAFAQQGQKPKDEAIYWMSAETVSGMATGRPSGVEKALLLQLGSTRRDPAPSASHLPPEGLLAGKRLPLVTPGTGVPTGEGRPEYPTKAREKPKGRIELYWGCGETVASGQPVIVDLAATSGAAAAQLASPANVRAMSPPSAATHATYGEWAGDNGGQRVPRAGSLVGDHKIEGSYTPDIRFTVAAASDFLPALSPRINAQPSGSSKVSWSPIAGARGYILSVTSARDDGTLIMWTSSAVRMPALALPDYMAQSDIAQLVQQGILLSPSAADCSIPAAVSKSSGSAMLMMTAYGSESDYRAPPSATAGWAVKLRTKATHISVLGIDMPSLAPGGEQDAPDITNGEEAKPRKRRGLLRGVVGGALGLPG